MSNTTSNSTTAILPNGIWVTDRAAYLAKVHIGIAVPLLVATTAVFCARFYPRVWPRWRVGLVEWFILAGFVFSIVSWVLLMFQMVPTPSVISFAQATNAIMLAFFAIPLWNWSMTAIKVSAALSLLRIKNTPPWKIFLYGIIVVQSLYCIAVTIFLFQICRPLAGWWDFSLESTAQCTDANTVRIMSTTGSAINLLTDLCLSLSPVTFLWRLNRPVRERILVCLLMGMGLFASAASIAKAVIVLNWVRQPGDDLWSMAVSIATWTVTEQFVGVMAACFPFLKPLVQRCLSHFGISLTRYHTNEIYSGGPPGTRLRMKPIPISSSNETDEPQGHPDQGSGGTTQRPSSKPEPAVLGHTLSQPISEKSVVSSWRARSEAGAEEIPGQAV